MNLVLLERGEVAADGTVTLDGVRARHLQQVLAVAPGQSVRVGLVNAALGTGIVTAIAGGTVTLRCMFSDSPPRPRVDLLLAVPRPKVLKRLWAQLAALGVGRIMLTNAARVERPYFDTHVLAPGTYRPLLIEGLQQARDTHLPVVTVHRQFRMFVEDELEALAGPGTRVVADPAASAPIRTLVTDAARVLVAVGPEGGWNGFELSLLEAHGFRRAGLGPRTLRTDTACIALLALVHEAIAPAG